MASVKEKERWQAKRGTVLERSKYMFNNPLLSDIKFIFPDTDATIPAHKYVLAVSSPVFFAMFYGNLAESRETIDISDIDPDTFLHFLRFIYCDEANFQDIDSAIKVWHLAVEYDIPSIARECAKFLDGNLDPLRTFCIIPFAQKFKDQTVETMCWEVIDYNAQTVAEDESFLDVKYELLLSFLERSSLRIKEINLFQAVDRWAAKRCEERSMTADGSNKRLALGEDLLRKIRFPLMIPKQFSDVVLAEQILTQDEVIDVFKSFYSAYSDSTSFSILPRVANTDVRSCRMTNDPLLKTSWQYVNESVMLTFVASKSVLLCGLQFLFSPTATYGCVSLSIWKEGAQMKQLTARSRDDSWNTSSMYGENKVFFNRPIQVDPNTCYTLELLGASSRSPIYYVTNVSSGFCKLPVGSSPRKTEVDFRFCEGLVANTCSIPNTRPYVGHIEHILFQNNFDN